MKTIKIVLRVTFFLLWVLNVNAQKISIWIGGTPGMEQDWNCPKNWDNQKVPDHFTIVIIPDVSTSSFHMPVIEEGTFSVYALRMETNAPLSILPEGKLTVMTTVDGYNGYNIILEGAMFLLEEHLDFKNSSIAALKN